MFINCNAFESDLSGWNVSKVTKMENMFRNCYKFKSDLSGWNVSNVSKHTDMFYRCTNMLNNTDLHPIFS